MIRRSIALAAALTIAAPLVAAPATLGLTDQTLGVDLGAGADTLSVGHQVSLDVGGDAGEVVWVLLSFTPPPANPPLIGGVPLAVDPNAVFVIAAGFPLPGSGTLALPAAVPTDIPAGVDLFVQVGLTGAGGPRLTNGLALTTATEPLAPVDAGEVCGHPLGATGGSTVITDDPSWQAFWTQHVSQIANPPPAPTIDFSQDSVVAFFLGPQVIHNILVDVEQVVSLGTGLQLDITVDVPTGTCNTPGNTCPYAIVTIPAAVAAPVAVTNVTVGFYTCP